MTNYIIPYFKGLGPSGNDGNGGGVGGSGSICDGKTEFARIDSNSYFFINRVKSDIYLENDGVTIKRNRGFPDPEIGRIVGAQIEIYKKYENDVPDKELNNAFVGGRGVCK